MKKNYKQIRGTPVVQFDSGDLLAIIEDIIINPDDGKIEAFWVKPAYLPVNHAVLLSQSIIKWGQKIYIKNEDEISPAEDLIKISEILSREILFVGNQVKNEAKEDLGWIYDLVFDNQKWYLKSIYTAKYFLGIKYHKRIFSYDSIIEAFPDYILVKDIQAVKIKEGIVVDSNEKIAGA